MPKFRKVYSTFWEDEFIESLTPEQKYFYLFLLTNPHVTACGIYSITLRKIEFLTGYNLEVVKKLLELFITKRKIKYNQDYSEILICNWAKYNLTRGGRPVWDCLKSELQHIKSHEFIAEIASTIDSPEIKRIYESSYESLTTRGQEEEGEGEGEGEGRDESSTVPTNDSSSPIDGNQTDVSNISYLDSPELKKSLEAKFLKLDVDSELEKMKDWLQSNGKHKNDYGAFARIWCRNAKETQKPKLRSLTA